MDRRRRRGNRKVAAENLRKLRVWKDMSQTDLAMFLGLKNRSTVTNWEAARCLPSEDLIDRLKVLYGVRKDVLIGKEEFKIARSDSALHWKYREPDQSGVYLAFVQKEGYREYAVLHYDYDLNKWSQRKVVYVNPFHGNKLYTCEELEGEVLQWATFPLSDCDLEGVKK